MPMTGVVSGVFAPKIRLSQTPHAKLKTSGKLHVCPSVIKRRKCTPPISYHNQKWPVTAS